MWVRIIWGNSMILMIVAIIITSSLLEPCKSDVIKIYKCCGGYNEYLNEHSECVQLTTKNVTDWAPVVYVPSKPRLLDPGTTPANWLFLENRRPDCKGSNSLTYVREDPGAYVTFDNGSLFLQSSNKLIDPDKFCLARKGALVCLKQEHSAVPEKQVKKCCGQGAVYSEERTSCVLINSSDSRLFVSENTLIISGFPMCRGEHSYAITGKLDVNYSLNMDGTLRTSGTVFDMKEYCVEKILENLTENPSIFTCEDNLKAVHGVEDGDSTRYLIYSSAMFLSAFFLAITLVASCLLPATYHALHWRCQTHYVACLLAGDLLLAIIQISGDSLQSSSTCVVLATSVHFLFLAAFFWLNTMCFNIWWTFRDIRPTSLDKGQEACRLKLYEIYAWGGPLIIVIVGALMDQVLHHRYPDVLRPRFGERKCWFFGDMELLVYFFGPVGLLLLINLVLFAATTRELTCGLWKREMVKSNTERTALSHICVKLVIVMGVTWIVDVISWMIGGPDYLWYPTDIVNGLQGFFIFLVVGCQPQVLSSLKKLWCFKNGDAHNSSRNGGSSSTNAPPSSTDNNEQLTNSTKAVETLC